MESTAANIIYGLACPVSDEIRYIGKSSRGLVRPRQQSWPSMLRPKTHKNHWVKSLLATGAAPKIVVLEELSDASDLNPAEMFWIAQGFGLGWRLTNLTRGGAGGALTKDGRERLSEQRRAFYQTDEGRAVISRIGATQRAQARDPVTRSRFERTWAATRGRKHSSETLDLMSASKVRRWADPEYKQKQSETRKRLWADPEYQARVSAAIRASKAKKENG